MIYLLHYFNNKLFKFFFGTLKTTYYGFCDSQLRNYVAGNTSERSLNKLTQHNKKNVITPVKS